jgi:adenosylcobinamide hydrolase
MIRGLRVAIDERAVVVAAEWPLRVLSSAVRRGGLGEARTIVNLHVDKHHPSGDLERPLTDFIAERGLAEPCVGLLTAAWTEHAEVAHVSASGFAVTAVATVGLSNRTTAGRAVAARWYPSTINTIVIVDGQPEAAALVNAVVTVTEAKALALAEAGVLSDDGHAATGTSTDAIVVAATGRGPAARFGGPASEMGAAIGRAALQALERGIAAWKARNP